MKKQLFDNSFIINISCHCDLYQEKINNNCMFIQLLYICIKEILNNNIFFLNGKRLLFFLSSYFLI